MRTLTVAAPILGLSLVLAACGGSGGGAASIAASAAAPSEAPASSAAASESAPASESASAAASASASASAATGGGSVELATTSLGSVLVGPDGKTLYIFTPDAAAPGKSVCNGECATAWPPLMGDAPPTAGTGLDASKFTVITRDDGSKQIAYFDQPLYYFAADAAAGDVKGQGLNDKWYVIGADGTAIK